MLRRTQNLIFDLCSEPRDRITAFRHLPFTSARSKENEDLFPYPDRLSNKGSNDKRIIIIYFFVWELAHITGSSRRLGAHEMAGRVKTDCRLNGSPRINAYSTSDSSSETLSSGCVSGSTNKVTFNEELANGDLEVVDKLVEVQKDVRGNPPAERPRVGALKTPVTRRQMPRVGVRRRRMRARWRRPSASSSSRSRRGESTRLRGRSVRQKRSAARQKRSAARRIASARGSGARRSGRTFLEPKPHVRSSAVCPGSAR